MNHASDCECSQCVSPVSDISTFSVIVILVFLTGLVMWFGSRVAVGQVLPDPKLTPGLADPTKTKQIICAKGYTTKNVRPKGTYTNALKKQQMRERLLPGNPSDYEEDHLISLELGGDPKSPLNLWPQLWKPEPGARAKDEVENALHKLVCQGKIPLQEAQKEIASNWWLAYLKYVKKQPDVPELRIEQ